MAVGGRYTNGRRYHADLRRCAPKQGGTIRTSMECSRLDERPCTRSATTSDSCYGTGAQDATRQRGATMTRCTKLWAIQTDNPKRPFRSFQKSKHTEGALSVYGESLDAVPVEVLVREVSEDETPNFYAWWENSTESFPSSFVWPSRTQVSVCFPYGPEVLEERGEGKLLPVNVSLVKTK